MERDEEDNLKLYLCGLAPLRETLFNPRNHETHENARKCTISKKPTEDRHSLVSKPPYAPRETKIPIFNPLFHLRS
jgi:hypothetical protein